MNLLFQLVRHAYDHHNGKTSVYLRNLSNLHGLYTPENNLVVSAA